MITKEEALERVIQHFAQRNRASLDIREGWPQGCYRASDEPVWSVQIPQERFAVGSSRYVVVSQATGEILADQQCGE